MSELSAEEYVAELKELRDKLTPTTKLLNELMAKAESGRRKAYREGFLACREAAAKVARGDVFKERYRTWPFRGGDRSNENEITRHSDDIANAIEALTPGER